MYVAMGEIKEENKITTEMTRDAFNEKERPDIATRMPDTKEEIISIDPSDSQVLPSDDTESGAVIMENDLEIKMDAVPLDSIGKNTELVEIKDNRVLSSLTQIIPNATQLAAATSNAIIAGKETVYRVVLPVGETLAKAADGDGLRGFSMGAHGIKSNGRFYEVNQSLNKVFNVTATVMSITSIIVGQYYMSRIESKLDGIKGKIDRIYAFQDGEYKGKIMALLVQIRKISAFQDEIMENEGLCSEKIATLDSIEHRCAELLGQANNMVYGIIQKKCPDFITYEKVVSSLNEWYDYQSILIEVLYNIAVLEYTLYKGKVSLEQCSSFFDEYSGLVKNNHDCLREWHDYHIEKFEVDLSKEKRKREGIDGMIHHIPGIFDDSHNYDDVQKDTAYSIRKQRSREKNYYKLTNGLYSKDVCLVLNKGKWYYCVPITKRKSIIIIGRNQSIKK